MQVINKKISVIFICLSIFIFGIFKLFNKEQIVLDNVVLDIKEPKDSLAIYIEKYDEDGNASYVESNDSTFPLDNNYIYNKELSGCLDSNSNEVEDALKYDYVKKELNLRVNKPVTCYVYYDYKGEGTEKVPYKIRSVEDLLDLSKKVNEGTTYANTYFELTRDLDFQDINSYNDSERMDYGNLNGIADDGNKLMNELTSGTGWVPIGTSATISFQGIFDGNNKRIDNLYENRTSRGGLFLFMNDATIKNLTLSGEVTTNSNDVGGIIATTYGNTTIINCHNEANVTSLANSGASAGGIAGGCAGTRDTSNKTIIKNSSNRGNINGSNNIGGLVGSHTTDLTIEDSYNDGIVTNSLGLSSGGLLGRDASVTTATKILNSYNNGKVITNGTERNVVSGGLVGRVYGNAYINSSYNSEEISSEVSGWIGGLIGRNEGKTIITKSKNEGNINGGTRIGGLVGTNYNDKSITIIDKSYNIGNLSTLKVGAVIGGISSYAWNGAQIYVFNSYNVGNIETNSGHAGFISRIDGDTINSQKAIIINSYNIGNILNSNIGVGFSNLISGTLKLDNVYDNTNFNNVTTKYGIGQFTTGQDYSVTKAYYKNTDNILGSNITNNEIIGKDLNYMQSNDFVTDLNNNIDSIKLTDYIDNTLLTEFKETTGYDLTLSKWTLKDNYPVLVSLEDI